MAENYPPPTPPTPPGPPSMQPPGTVPPPPPGGAPPPPATQPLPWEQPNYPVLEALYETAKLFITAPSQAFARMSLTGSLGRPLLYAVIFGWIGIIANQAYGLAFRGMMMNFFGSLGMGGPFAGRAFHFPIAFSIIAMIFAPIFVMIGVFILSAIFHLFLMLVGGATTGFASTVRVLCYAYTVQIVQVVPICGGWIGAIWAAVLWIIGLAIAHRTTQGKSALAVLLPLALCCVCVVILAITFGAAIAAAVGHLRH
jgi:hypothetical protein